MAGYIKDDLWTIKSKYESVHVCETQMPVSWGKMAMEFVARWGMVAAVEDGEDSAGRSKVRLATSDEVVQRACETAEKLWAEMERRGVLLDIPMPEKIRDKEDA